MQKHNYEVEIFVGDFQEFDSGGKIREDLPKHFQVGDTFFWRCAQFDGMAIVDSIVNGVSFIKKIN